MNHAMTAVAYGIEKGVEYVVIKNQWGVNWGE
jgi:C1A family cysteine protease